MLALMQVKMAEGAEEQGRTQQGREAQQCLVCLVSLVFNVFQSQ